MEKISGYDAYDIHNDANSIANGAFGRDFETDAETLNDIRLHAEGCGCGTCLQGYQTQLETTMSKYVSPYEK